MMCKRLKPCHIIAHTIEKLRYSIKFRCVAWANQRYLYCSFLKGTITLGDQTRNVFHLPSNNFQLQHSSKPECIQYTLQVDLLKKRVSWPSVQAL